MGRKTKGYFEMSNIMTSSLEDQSEAHKDVLAKLALYALHRKSDVASDAQTPELASLLVEKYGYGLCDAFAICYGRDGPRPTYADVDAVVASLAGDWKSLVLEHAGL